jgi:hypothetical protein
MHEQEPATRRFSVLIWLVPIRPSIYNTPSQTIVGVPLSLVHHRASARRQRSLSRSRLRQPAYAGDVETEGESSISILRRFHPASVPTWTFTMTAAG